MQIWNTWRLINAWFILFILWCQKLPPSRRHLIMIWHSWRSKWPRISGATWKRRMTGVSCISSYRWEQRGTQFTRPKSNDKNINLFFDISALKLLVVFCHLVLQQVKSSIHLDYATVSLTGPHSTFISFVLYTRCNEAESWFHQLWSQTIASVKHVWNINVPWGPTLD